MTDLKKPEIEEVNIYLATWEISENYVLQEKSLNKLFQQFPKNNDITDILLKSATLNDFYSAIYLISILFRNIF
ncbi:hypothetical protein E4T92_02135 [Pasteurella sp. WM03]|nr:hypothetical protein [Pasteurella sp. 19428wF3_WM03]TFU53219.1 hypothetical protein E4T92_02135 [Pasteurella sp. WM03]